MLQPLRIASTLALGLSFTVATAFAQRAAAPAAARGTPPDATVRIVAAARVVLTSLDEANRTQLQFPFDSAQRTGWSNLPSGIFERHGIRIGDLTPTQRAAV